MPPKDSYLAKLRQLLISYFDKEELRTLCFDLNVDYDSLRAEGKVAVVRELILLLARQERLPELIATAQHERPQVSWPPIPPDLGLPSADEQSSTSAAKPTFNIGDVQASVLNVGGEQTISGPVSVDMREIHGDHIEMSGDFRGGMVNLKSRLDRVTQTILAAPHGDVRQKVTFTRLMDELVEALAQLPRNRAKDVQKIFDRVEAMACEMEEDVPDKKMVEITGQSLKRVAEKVSDVLPTVIDIAGQIVAVVLEMLP